jgi:serine/threonine protein kinase
MAPEQARGGPLTTAVDVWGIGAVLFAALAGRRAFVVPDDDDSYPQLETRAPRLAGMPGIPTAIASLVDQCLEPSPGDRPSVAELGAGLATWLDGQVAGSAA